MMTGMSALSRSEHALGREARRWRSQVVAWWHVLQLGAQILVLVLTSASDSELVIHLINEAQIYRFLNKPVNLSLMQQYLHSAIGRHAEYRSAPELLDRHRVRQSKSADGSFGRGILERLKTIKWPFVPARS